MNNPQSNKLISDNMACRDDCIPIVFGLLGLDVSLSFWGNYLQQNILHSHWEYVLVCNMNEKKLIRAQLFDF